jgi:hypothetical protein
MTAAGGGSPAELWTGLMAAARGERSSAVARAALALSVDEGRPRLGWVIPPPWEEVEQRIARVLRAVPSVAGSLIVATGGWAFAALAAAETAAPGYRLSVVDTLDAGRLARYLAGHDGAGAALAVSGSGQTYETRCLAEVVSVPWRSRPGGGGLVWLTGTTVAGGLALRAPDAINALLGGPSSVPFAVACALTGPERFRRAYEQFARLAPQAGYRAAELACAVPARPGARISLLLPGWTGTGVRLWALQALRQGLGGKPGGPAWCDVGTESGCPAGADPARGPAGADVGGGAGAEVGAGAGGDGGVGAARAWLASTLAGGVAGPGPDPAGTDVDGGGIPGAARIRLAGVLPCEVAEPGLDPASALVGAMVVMYATAVVVACLGLRFGVAFASHPAVAGYKGLLVSRPGCDEVVVGPSGAGAAAAEWLAGRAGLLGAHLVDYGSGVSCAEPGRGWEVHLGSRWNHHSYQAVHGERRLGVVAVVGDRPPEVRTGDGSLDGALRGLHARQVAIARATCASLDGRALLIRVAGPGRGR